MTKEIAKSFTTMAMGEAMQTILDRTRDVTGLETQLLEHWAYDLYARRPGPALLENGVLTPTDLDLACFLSALVQRQAVINLPTYKARRARTEREGEVVLSKDNRHGKIVGLTANKEAFSFSVRILDQNVMQAGSEDAPDSTGAFRNFMLVDVDGAWHDGWKKIQFVPTAKENAFLTDKSLWTGNQIVFTNFVHPNRWTSFFGQYYFLTKALIQRLEEENQFYRTEEKRLLASGLAFPRSGEHSKKEWPKTEKTGEDKAITVPAFEAEVDVPWTGAFTSLATTEDALFSNSAKIKARQYTVLPELRFAARATELAFFQSMKQRHPAFPSWIKGAAWEEGYVLKGKRTAWNRLPLVQLFPGQTSFALRFRVYEKTERVAT